MRDFLEMIFEEAGFRVAAADDERQGVLQARQFEPAVIVTERPFRDEKAFGGVPVLFAQKPFDETVILARARELIEERDASAPPRAPVEPPARTPTPPAKPSRQWVVLLGSDPAARASIDLAILGLGLDVAGARDATHLFLRARTLKPKMIVCDLDQPGLGVASGFLHELRENEYTRGIPVVFISAGAEEGAPALLASVIPLARFTAKPLDPVQLQALILNLLTGAAHD